MRIGRTLPPAAAPISLTDIANGFKASLRGQEAIELLRQDIINIFQVKHCFLASSGKAALTLALQAMHKLQPDRDEVLIPAYTCYSVPSAVVRAGLRVRLCDVDPESLDVDPDCLQQQLRSGARPLAVLCQHLYGLPGNIAAARNAAQAMGAFLIEDAAQSMGTVHRQSFLGTSGDVGFFSLGRGKALSAVSGGILLTDSRAIAKGIDRALEALPPQSVAHGVQLRAYAAALSALLRPWLFWIPRSLPGLKLGETIYDPWFAMHRFASFQSGLIQGWPAKLKAMQFNRGMNVHHWSKALVRFSWLHPVHSVFELDEVPSLLRLPVRVRQQWQREALLQASDKHGLGIMPSYPDSIEAIKGLEIANPETGFPAARQCASRLVTFPVHSYVTEMDRHRALQCLAGIEESSRTLG
jgi:dTDP-4-amino-4,6-dideoxygalactose transaminase